MGKLSRLLMLGGMAATCVVGSIGCQAVSGNSCQSCGTGKSPQVVTMHVEERAGKLVRVKPGAVLVPVKPVETVKPLEIQPRAIVATPPEGTPGNAIRDLVPMPGTRPTQLPTTETAEPATTIPEPIVAKPRRSTNFLGNPRADRCPNHTWFVGEVVYLNSKKAWRLRFAPLDAEAEFGGTVTLSGSDDLFEKLQDGQLIRIEGELLNRDIPMAPPFLVKSLKVMD